MFDVVIVGGGPAGLSAALMLGRCRRRVLLCDSGHPRNEASHAMHGFLTRDGMPPAEFLARAREELKPYDTVELRHCSVTSAECVDGAFVTTLKDGEQFRSRKLLLATGVCDNIPQLEGMEGLYGRSVFIARIAMAGRFGTSRSRSTAAASANCGLSVELTLWSRDLVLCPTARLRSMTRNASA